MTKRLGVVMDPIASIKIVKDSTFAMLLEAQARGYEIHYFELKDLFVRDGIPCGVSRLLKVKDDVKSWFEFGAEKVMPLGDLQVILMRKDPPFNKEYIYATYILECAERLGTVVVNKPQALRDYNEKFVSAIFPAVSPPTLITQSKEKLNAFWHEHGDIVCKPLDGMGGVSIYRLMRTEVNANVIFDTLTHNEQLYIMAQKFIPEIREGDRRVIVINGEAFPHVLARMPQGDDWRGNLAVGAKGVVKPITEREKEIVNIVGPAMKEHGVIFAGLDVIGDYLTEINLTSPTCIREIDAHSGSNISRLMFDVIEQKK